MNSAEPREPHWIHLLEAHSAELLAECHRARLYLAVCGEELTTEALPSSECEVGCERDVVYCLACLRAANARNYDAGVDVDCPPRGDGAGRAVSAPLAAGVSHVLVANDALILGRFGSPITLCGEEMRQHGAIADEHECVLGGGCVRYCPESVREAARFSAKAVDRMVAR